MIEPDTPEPLPRTNPDTVVRGLVNRSERIAWVVAGCACTAFVIAELWPRFLPKPPTEVRVPIYVNSFGEQRTQQQLNDPQKLSLQESQEVRDLRTWALARYRYHYSLARQDYYTVRCFSSEPVFNDYDSVFRDVKRADFIDSDKVKDSMVIDARWIGAALLDPEPGGDRHARVTIELVTRYRDRADELQPPAQRVVVQARYRYEPAMRLPQQCGDQNNVRFVMLTARGTPEITGSVSTAAGARP